MPYLVEQPFRQTEEYFRQSDAVLLGTGAIHAHDHIPQGIDAITTDYFLRELERRLGLLVAPSIAFGPMDNYMDYPGCISPRISHFTEFVGDVAQDLYRWGARRFFVINGHGGNTAPLLEIGYRLRKQGAIMPVLEWWKLIATIDPDLNKAVNALPSGVEPGRRARTRGVETAAAMALLPGVQVPDDIRVIYARERFGKGITTNFATGVNFRGTFVPLPLGSRETTDWGEPGTAATPEMGQQVLDACLDFMTDFITEMLAVPVPEFSEI